MALSNTPLWPCKCRWCDTIITKYDSYGCNCCGAYVCKNCWGPDGNVCIYCYERAEYLDDHHCQICDDKDEDCEEDCDCGDECDDDDCGCEDCDCDDDEDDR